MKRRRCFRFYLVPIYLPEAQSESWQAGNKAQKALAALSLPSDGLQTPLLSPIQHLGVTCFRDRLHDTYERRERMWDAIETIDLIRVVSVT